MLGGILSHLLILSSFYIKVFILLRQSYCAAFTGMELHIDQDALQLKEILNFLSSEIKGIYLPPCPATPC